MHDWFLGGKRDITIEILRNKKLFYDVWEGEGRREGGRDISQRMPGGLRKGRSKPAQRILKSCKDMMGYSSLFAMYPYSLSLTRIALWWSSS
jgi:hypothetical protein